MDFYSLSPHEALKEFIQKYHYQHIDFSAEAVSSMKYDFYPSYSQCLMLYLGDPGSRDTPERKEFEIDSGPHIVSTQLYITTLCFRGLHRVFTINFTSGGLFRLLQQPLTNLVNSCLGAEDLMDSSIRGLTEQLKNTFLPEELKNITDRFFLKRLTRIKPAGGFDIVMQRLSENPLENYTVDAVAKAACLSIKQVERFSYDRFGVSPKLYLKLMRFSKAWALKERLPDLSWTEIAHQSGYYDQNHFIKEFKKFTGITPSGAHEKNTTAIPFRRHIE